MPPPALNYSTTATPTRRVATAVAVGLLCLGIWVVGRGLYRVFGPPTASTTADQKVVVHNAWSAVVIGGVLMVPAACVVAGLLRERTTE
jgi:hypothetical protein